MSDVPPSMILRSEVLSALGFAHGFSTRHGGVSEGPYATLNLGGAGGDDPERVRENHRRLARAVGYDPERLHQSSQVHGKVVVTVGEHDEVAATWRLEADGLLARDPGVAVAVRTADCVPVLLASPSNGRVAAVHAGWRGVAQRILAEAVVALETDPSDLVAAVGPSIGPCCFEVGEEVAAELSRAAVAEVILRPVADQRPHVDLWGAVERQLGALGVRRVDTLRRCTRCEGDAFFSFRRDGQRSGRMVGVIVARSGPKTF